MPNHPLIELGRLGQSPWYDFITRDLIRSGELARLIREDGLQGMTSNPTIFEKAVASSGDYDDDIRRGAGLGLSAGEIFETIAIADVQAACDAFRPLHDSSGGIHGLVSLEVSPTLANDTAGTIAEAERLWRGVNRPNAMIKIPGTLAGLPAIARATELGISVNITLLFAVSRYEAVIDAYLSGLEARVKAGAPIDRIRSVASFFVSRVDARIDPILDQAGDPRKIRGKAAIANAGLAYQAFERSLTTPRWQRLASHGATTQRPLWASTSTKDPRYPDVYYIEALVARDTVNTIPPDTFKAYHDHGHPVIRIHDAIREAPSVMAALAEQGVKLDEVTAFLETDGVTKFAASYASLLKGIESKAEALV